MCTPTHPVPAFPYPWPAYPPCPAPSPRSREGFSTTPGVTWADVGSLGDVREELSFAITHPIRHPGDFEAMGLTAACGVLLVRRAL